jgi:hypothetical protein
MRLIRRKILVGGLTLVVAHFAWVPSLLAQNDFIEPNAPERVVSGCYRVDPGLPDRLMRTNFSPDSQLVLLPDTIELTLQADHAGTIFNADSWRSAGWMLRVRPDPWLGLHIFAHWQLDERRNLSVSWPIGPGTDRDFGSGVYQRLFAAPNEMGFTGVATRHQGVVTIDSASVTLERVECPDASYFDIGRWWKRTKQL